MDELDALWAFLVAGVVALVLTPLAARLARRVGAIDLPKERGLHDEPTPSLGGLAILAGVLAGAAFLPWNTETRGILAGAAAIALIGALDDVKDGGLLGRRQARWASSPRRRSRWPPTSAWRT